MQMTLHFYHLGMMISKKDQQTQPLSHFASQVGFQLNTKRTDEMRFNTQTSNNLEVDGN